MKKIYSFLFLLSFPFLLFASLNPNTPATVFDHLKEVNKEWTKQIENFASLQSIAKFQEDEDRIRLHLLLVEKTLRGRDIQHLSISQKINRAHHLDVLSAYTKNRIFPQNIYHSDRQPYFVDYQGTACAVGHLVRESGEKDLVDLISRQDNFAYISELVKYKPLSLWATKNGFTLAELAWIQPGYPPAPKQIHQVGNGGGANGEITVMESGFHGLYIAGNFTEIDGFMANGIVLWDTENWSNLGEGLIGDIDEIVVNYDIFVSGNFTIVATGQQTQLAVFKNDVWTALIEEDFTGEVRDILRVGTGYAPLYIGGNFTEVNGIPCQNVAICNYDSDEEVWSISENECQLATNAPINSLFGYEGDIYLAGEFSEISYICPQDTTVLTTNALGIFDRSEDNLSPQPFFGGFEKLDEIHVRSGQLRAYEHRIEETLVHGLTGGTWSSAMYFDTEGTQSATLHGFADYGSYSSLLYGDTQEGGGISSIYGNGIVFLSSDGSPSSSGIILPNGAVRAAKQYSGQVYFAGDFTEIQGEEFNGLASSNFNQLSAVPPIISEVGEFQIFQEGNRLITRYEELENETDFTLFNINGQMAASLNLTIGDGQREIDVSNMPIGVYFYVLQNELGQLNRKILIVK